MTSSRFHLVSRVELQHDNVCTSCNSQMNVVVESLEQMTSSDLALIELRQENVRYLYAASSNDRAPTLTMSMWALDTTCRWSDQCRNWPMSTLQWPIDVVIGISLVIGTAREIENYLEHNNKCTCNLDGWNIIIYKFVVHHVSLTVVKIITYLINNLKYFN